jgi:type I restriction enzyme S subunit
LIRSSGTTAIGIRQTELRRVEITLPPLTEQRGIANVLKHWNLAIDYTNKLIAAKAKCKRGLMQQLLTGKRRFQEFGGQEWKLMSISDFTIPAIRIRPKPDKTFLALGIRSHGKGTFLKTDFDPAKIEMTELYEVRENDLIVNITFAWEGAIAIAKADDTGALVSHRFPTYEFNTELAIPEYFRHVIVQKWFVERLGLISPGGAGRNRVMSKREFGKLEVLMPSVEEQCRIAKVLNACDKEIDLLKQQLNAVKRQKRGLMQKLLTGQIRMKVGDVEAATVEAS